MNIVGTLLVALLIPVAGILGTLLGKLLVSLIGKIRNETLQQLAYTGVRWAEQQLKTTPGSDRFASVRNYIAGKLPGVDEEDVRKAIEAAVKTLHIELGEEVSLPTKP